MKKMMIVAAAIAMAITSQAVTFKWNSSAAGYAIDAAALSGKGNGNYGVGSSDLMSSVGTFTYVLTMYEAGTYGKAGEKVVGSASGDVSFGGTGKYTLGGNVDVSGTAYSTTYDYVLAITGSQSDILALGSKVAATDGNDGTYDYTAAQLAWTATGSITTKSSGTAQLTDLPGTFAVSGIQFTAAPEPTSGLLLLIGMAGLALRRRRA